MYDLAAAPFEALADLRAQADDDARQADAAYEAYCDGSGDFGDRCYWGDRANDSALELAGAELAFAYRFLALELAA